MSECANGNHVWKYASDNTKSKPQPGLRCDCGRYTWAENHVDDGRGWYWLQGPNGDVDVLPDGEEHERGAECRCEPEIEVCGANLVITHNAFNHREIVEQAMEIIKNA